MLTMGRVLVLSAFACVCAAACAFDWDTFDPRLADATTAGNGGVGGVGQGGSPDGGQAGQTMSGGAPPTSPCGTTAMLADDFEDGALGKVWYASGSSAVTLQESNGVRSVALPAMEQSWAAFDTRHLYDLRSGAVSLEVVEMVDTSSTAAAFLNVGFHLDYYVSMVQEGGILTFADSLMQVWNVLDEVSYSPSEHRFWQIREEGGTLYWETSADGTNWNVGVSRTLPSSFTAALALIEIGALTQGNEAAPGTFRFDNLNGGGVSDVGWCPIANLQDDFDDGVMARHWSRSWEEASVNLDESGGQLSISFDGSQSGAGGVVSAQSFDFTGGEVAVEVIASGLPAASSFLRLELDHNNAVAITALGSELLCERWSSGMLLDAGSVPFSATDQRFWRLREQGGSFYCEMSADGGLWSVFGLAEMPIDPKAVDVIVGGGVSSATRGEVLFDNYNLLP
jgi:hypothetical protein